MAAPQQRPSVKKPSSYSSLNPSLAFQLSGPHTWAAALTPVLLAYIYSGITYSGNINFILALILLAISILMQSAVNVLNDYFDYKKGTDSLENSSEDAFDAVLVYNHLNPRTILLYAISLLVLAAILGFYLVFITGWPLLILGLIGALAVVLYSAGNTPISYLPVGEFVSGIVMGGLITLASCYVLSGILDPRVLLISLPCIIGIGMILFTNNTCDIEKDIPAHRKTISVLLGRNTAVKTYRAMIAVWLLVIVAIVGIFYAPGMPFILLLVLAAFPTLRALFSNPLNQSSRDGAMAQITTLNVLFTAFYCLALASSAFLVWI